MVVEFVIPLHAEDLELERPERYYAQSDSTLIEKLGNSGILETRLLSIRSQLQAELDTIQHHRLGDSLVLLQQETINLLYGVSKDFDSLSCSLQNQFLSYLQAFIEVLVRFWRKTASRQSDVKEKNTNATCSTMWEHNLRNSIKFVVYILYLCLKKSLRLQVSQSLAHKITEQSGEQVNLKDVRRSWPLWCAKVFF